MHKFHCIASGSSGNCYCIETDEKALFVDCGTPFKRISENLDRDELAGKDVSLFITHEHTDHIGGIKPFINALSPTIYTSEGTAWALDDAGIDTTRVMVVEKDVEYDMQDFSVKPFRISHDAAQPLGFRINTHLGAVVFATDLGYADDYVMRNLEDCHTLILESNYDEEMLRTGSYPQYLKKRISGSKGHLSNRDAAALLNSISGSITSKVFLAHVSDDNNDYEILDSFSENFSVKSGLDVKVLRKGEALAGLKL